ncbi:ubiquitin-like protein 4, partial [Phenoliferia sp. Uapishka_3]
MERVLQGDKLSLELDYFKKTSDTLGTLKQKYSASHVPPPSSRPKRATLVNIAACEPPTLHNASTDPSTSTSPQTLSLTIKSTKPPLLFTIKCPETSTIATLKSLLCAQESTAPGVEQQRWVYKGKVLADGKLLKEFGVVDGAVINLMIKASTPSSTSTPAPATPEPTTPPLPTSIPTLT